MSSSEKSSAKGVQMWQVPTPIISGRFFGDLATWSGREGQAYRLPKQPNNFGLHHDAIRSLPTVYTVCGLLGASPGKHAENEEEYETRSKEPANRSPQCAAHAQVCKGSQSVFGGGTPPPEPRLLTSNSTSKPGPNLRPCIMRYFDPKHIALLHWTYNKLVNI